LLTTVSAIGWVLYFNVQSAPERAVGTVRRLHSDRRAEGMNPVSIAIVVVGLLLVIAALVYHFTHTAATTIGNATQGVANQGASSVSGL
jgi:hypothetical protein